VSQHFGDQITTGDISGSSGVAIGRGAQSTVRNVNTGGGDYAEGGIDKRSGIFGGEFQGPAIGSVEGGTVIQGDSYSGNFQGAMLNIRSTLSNASQQIGAISSSDQRAKDELRQLIDQLGASLQQVPREHSSTAETAAKRAAAMVEEAAKPSPDREMIAFSGESLKKAAANLAQVAPTVLAIATQIVAQVGRLLGM
jgi:hypothetical protein